MSDKLQLVEPTPMEPGQKISFSEKQRQLIKDTFAKGATDNEFSLFMNIAERTGLDPFARQIFFIKRWDRELGREVGQPQTSIDGYRLIAERTENYCPGDDATFVEDSFIVSATAYVKKFVRGEWHTVSATAYFDEYAQKKKDGSLTHMWHKMPHIMIAKCAEALALRKAFPAELSGLYTREEMMQAEVEDDSPKPLALAPRPPVAENVIDAEVVTETRDSVHPSGFIATPPNSYPTATDLPNTDPVQTEKAKISKQFAALGFKGDGAKELVPAFFKAIARTDSLNATISQLQDAYLVIEHAAGYAFFVEWCGAAWPGSSIRKGELLGKIALVLHLEGLDQLKKITGDSPQKFNPALQQRLLENLNSYLATEAEASASIAA